MVLVYHLFFIVAVEQIPAPRLTEGRESIDDLAYLTHPVEKVTILTTVKVGEYRKDVVRDAERNDKEQKHLRITITRTTHKTNLFLENNSKGYDGERPKDD